VTRLRAELLPIVLLVLVASGVWLFAELAGKVKAGGTSRFDQTVLLALRNPADLGDPVGPPWLEDAERDLTSLGSIAVLTLLTLAACAFLVLDRKYRTAVLVLLAFGGALLLNTLLKHGFQRPRPELVPHGANVHSTSFPSGHSMLSAATYLTLGALLARLQPRRRLKAFLLGTAVLLTLIVGVSRIYLGVHWPTDVFAGWTAGGVWALACWLVAGWLERRGQVEPEAGPTD
jgi:undecaprenyl-diphosphatase